VLLNISLMDFLGGGREYRWYRKYYFLEVPYTIPRQLDSSDDNLTNQITTFLVSKTAECFNHGSFHYSLG
jgi:hypothetical protein